jgi:hypothetical protein
MFNFKCVSSCIVFKLQVCVSQCIIATGLPYVKFCDPWYYWYIRNCVRVSIVASVQVTHGHSPTLLQAHNELTKSNFVGESFGLGHHHEDLNPCQLQVGTLSSLLKRCQVFILWGKGCLRPRFSISLRMFNLVLQCLLLKQWDLKQYEWNCGKRLGGNMMLLLSA